MRDIDDALSTVRQWAQRKLDAEQEPPWAHPLYVRLKDTIEQIESARASVTFLEDSPESAQHLESASQQQGEVCCLDTARRRRRKAYPQLPM